MLAILKHELKTYFQGLTAYVFGAFLLFFTGIYLMMYNLKAAVSNFEFVIESLCLIFVVIVPILTMRVIAEERKQKTDQLLYSLPLSMTEIVLGKYLALLIVFCAPLLIMGIYPLILSQFGNVYFPVIYGTMFAFFALGASLIAIGMFISSTTESLPVAAGICFVIMIINYNLSSLTDYISSSAFGSYLVLFILILVLALLTKVMTKNESLAGLIAVSLIFILTGIYLLYPDSFSGLLPQIVDKVSLFERFDVFVNGTFDVTGIVYYFSVVIFFVFLTIQSLEKRRYS